MTGEPEYAYFGGGLATREQVVEVLLKAAVARHLIEVLDAASRRRGHVSVTWSWRLSAESLDQGADVAERIRLFDASVPGHVIGNHDAVEADVA